MKTLKNSLLGLAIAAASISATATTITVTGFSQPNPTTVHIVSGAPATAEYVYAGGFNTTNGVNSFVSWCVDILQDTYLGQSVSDYTLVSAASVSQIGAARADALARLATSYLGQVHDGTSAGAFQLAVWEIVYENTGTAYNIGTGNFSAYGANDASIALAQTWLGNLAAVSTYNVNVWASPTHQDLAVFTSVPEPGTLALLAVGLIGLGLGKRRKNQAAA